MRVSTSMIYDKGIAAIQRQTAELLHTQQQVSSGRRILTPADDPIAAARALEIDQSKAINAQFRINQGYAEDNLRLMENRLVGIGDILLYAHERAVQAGSPILSENELGFIATDLRAHFEALLGFANARDANGEFVFAGYKAGTKPFEGGLGAVSYEGDQGVRTIQVSSSRFLPISFPGTELFAKTQPVGDHLVTANVGVRADGTANLGDGALSGGLAPGFPNDPADYDLMGRRLEIVFNGTDYDVYEYIPGVAGRQTVQEGLADLADLGDPLSPAYRGVSVVPSGTPQAGDRFEVFVASPDLFANLAVFIDALEQPGPSGMTGGAVEFATAQLDVALDNVLRVRARVGSQLVEVERLNDVGSDLDLQYAQTLSRLQDVDYAEAISRLTQQQTFLEAAQQSYLRVTGLSLFNFLT